MKFYDNNYNKHNTLISVILSNIVDSVVGNKNSFINNDNRFTFSERNVTVPVPIDNNHDESQDEGDNNLIGLLKGGWDTIENEVKTNQHNTADKSTVVNYMRKLSTGKTNHDIF